MPELYWTCRMTSTMVVVLPVPGGPWTTASSRWSRAKRTASFWLSFKFSAMASKLFSFSFSKNTFLRSGGGAELRRGGIRASVPGALGLISSPDFFQEIFFQFRKMAMGSVKKCPVFTDSLTHLPSKLCPSKKISLRKVPSLKYTRLKDARITNYPGPQIIPLGYYVFFRKHLELKWRQLRRATKPQLWNPYSKLVKKLVKFNLL